MGDSGMSIFKFPSAIQLSSTTITTLFSTTHVSSPPLPPPNFLPKQSSSSNAKLANKCNPWLSMNLISWQSKNA
jgi:hypothetical protein